MYTKVQQHLHFCVLWEQSCIAWQKTNLGQQTCCAGLKKALEELGFGYWVLFLSFFCLCCSAKSRGSFLKQLYVHVWSIKLLSIYIYMCIYIYIVVDHG